MDLDEWESLSDLDFNEDGEKKIFPVGSESVVDMDYFFPSSPPRKHNQLVPYPILLERRIVKAPEKEEITKNHHHHHHVDQEIQDTVSSQQVFFKMKENEFVDMKIESPKSSSEAMEFITSPRRMKIEKRDMFGDGSNKEEEEEECTWEEENCSSGFNIWKWSLTGVGAICTFGVAAATICVLFFGSQKGKKLQQDQKIRFQIYSDDKRIKQVVQHATKLNEAISAVRGVPVSRAHITVGGYYDGL